MSLGYVFKFYIEKAVEITLFYIFAQPLKCIYLLLSLLLCTNELVSMDFKNLGFLVDLSSYAPSSVQMLGYCRIRAVPKLGLGA